MKICDKCRVVDRFHPLYEIVVVLEDQHFDLCEKHMDELMKFLQTPATKQTKETVKVFRKRKKAA